MYSIVVCSHRPGRARAIAAHYATLFRGHASEFILIDDAKSLCDGYARGFARAGGEVIVFSHDDIEFVTPDVPARLERHLAQYDVVGIAGTTRLIDGKWTTAGEPDCYALVINPAGEDRYSLLYTGAGPLCVPGMQALDGCFLACRRRVVEAVGFDAATFDGFHLYDVDFTFRAHLAGFSLAVCRDLALVHASLGHHDAAWQRANERFVAKFRGQLSTAAPGELKVMSAFLDRARIEQICRPENLQRAIRWP